MLIKIFIIATFDKSPGNVNKNEEEKKCGHVCKSTPLSATK